MNKPIALVLGVSGFIGSHMVAKLRDEGYFVRGLSRRQPRYAPGQWCDEFWTCDLREYHGQFFNGVSEVYNFACEVGGLGYIMDRANDAEMLRNSTLIDINVLEACRKAKVGKVFFASSACVYPNIGCAMHEYDAYPAAPLNEFAWQKLFAERLYQSYARNYGMDIKIGRIFNTYGPGMPWEEPRAKSVAALCRKVAEAKDGDSVEIWGDGKQRRSYTYVADTVEGIWRLMQTGRNEPVNIGYPHAVSILDLLYLIAKQAGKEIWPKFSDGPVGVREIVADCEKLKTLTGWRPLISPTIGLIKTYPWVEKQALDKRNAA